jgi:hypothetical protein
LILLPQTEIIIYKKTFVFFLVIHTGYFRAPEVCLLITSDFILLSPKVVILKCGEFQIIANLTLEVKVNTELWLISWSL